MPTLEEAKAVIAKLHGLSGDAEIARKAAARELARREPTDATELLSQVISLAHRGSGDASCVLGAFVAALAQEKGSIPFADSLKRIADVQDHTDVVALFADGPAKKEFNLDAAARADARLFSMSLGHLKQTARLTRSPDQLSKLAMASHPHIVQNALRNPRLTEALVVRIASRRPARPEPLIEIWKSKWNTRHEVRRALVFNPYTPPEIAAKIVPLLNASDWAELSRDAAVHESLREQAAALLARRRG